MKNKVFSINGYDQNYKCVATVETMAKSEEDAREKFEHMMESGLYEDVISTDIKEKK